MKSAAFLTMMVCLTGLAWDANAGGADDPYPVSGEKAINEALIKAKADSLKVLVVFSRDACPHCVKLGGFLSDKEVASIVAKGFVVVRLKSGITKDMQALRKQYAEKGDNSGGVPMCAFLDADGKVVASYLGFPSNEADVTKYVHTWKTAAGKANGGTLRPKDFQLLTKSLRVRAGVK